MWIFDGGVVFEGGFIYQVEGVSVVGAAAVLVLRGNPLTTHVGAVGVVFFGDGSQADDPEGGESVDEILELGHGESRFAVVGVLVPLELGFELKGFQIEVPLMVLIATAEVT